MSKPLTITPIGERSLFDEVLNEQLTQLVLQEVSQDAKEKKERINKIENLLLKHRAVLKKLRSKRESLLVEFDRQERRKKELRDLIQKIQTVKLVVPADVKAEVRQIFN